jgi:hypothetical protein
MINVHTPEFHKLWSYLIKSLRLKYENSIQQHPDANAVMEHVRGVLTPIARLAGCTPESVGESPKSSLIVQNMADIRRNLHQLLKGKQLYSALHEVYTVHELTALPK